MNLFFMIVWIALGALRWYMAGDIIATDAWLHFFVAYLFGLLAYAEKETSSKIFYNITTLFAFVLAFILLLTATS